eukprot:1686679-Prymnesium_polylepis.1
MCIRDSGQHAPRRQQLEVGGGPASPHGRIQRAEKSAVPDERILPLVLKKIAGDATHLGRRRLIA